MMHLPHLSFSYTLQVTMLASAQGAGRRDDSEGLGKAVNSGAQKRGTITPLLPDIYLRWHTLLKFICNIGHLREKFHGTRNLVTEFLMRC